MKKNRKNFKKALLEAAKWEDKLTDIDKSLQISYGDVRMRVLDRIFKKYKDKIIKKPKNTEKISKTV